MKMADYYLGEGDRGCLTREFCWSSSPCSKPSKSSHAWQFIIYLFSALCVIPCFFSNLAKRPIGELNTTPPRSNSTHLNFIFSAKSHAKSNRVVVLPGATCLWIYIYIYMQSTLKILKSCSGFKIILPGQLLLLLFILLLPWYSSISIIIILLLGIFNSGIIN